MRAMESHTQTVCDMLPRGCDTLPPACDTPQRKRAQVSRDLSHLRRSLALATQARGLFRARRRSNALRVSHLALELVPVTLGTAAIVL